MKNKNYSSDSPVCNKSEDRFSRWTFSERIAQVIAKRSDPSSIVIGLYGVWGNGKTSVLNFIQHALSKDDNVICIKFNPWRFGTEENLLKGFFNDIATALDTQLIKTGDKLKDLISRGAPAVGGILGAESTGNFIGSFLSGPDLIELRNRIEQELEKAKKRVLILIDDIDRLDKNEINAIFRLVKLTADFKYTAYILAFDKEVVSAALQDRYSSSVSNAGEAFLEKIIQVPLHLPSVETSILFEYCFEGIIEALEMAGIELSTQQLQEFGRDFTRAFGDNLTTPRKVKLYGNALLFSLPILKGEINPVDLMLIEAIRLFAPNLYDVIRKNKNLLTGLAREVYYSSNTKEAESIKNIIGSALDYDNCFKPGFIELLKSLFPKLQSVYGNRTFSNDWLKEWAASQRVCSEDYFSRYFSYAIPNGDISDQTINNIVTSYNKEILINNPENNPLASILTERNSEKLIKTLRQTVSSFSADQSAFLAIAISQLSFLFPNPDMLYSWSTPFSQAAMLISELIQNVDSKVRVKIAIECISQAKQLDFQAEVFKWLKRDDEERPEKDGFSKEERVEIGIQLANIIKTHMDSGNDITISYPKSAPLLLYIIEDYIGKEYINSYLSAVLKVNSDAIIRFLRVFTPDSWGLETGISHKSDFRRDNYNSVTKVFNPDLIILGIKNYLGDLPEIETSYPMGYENKNDNLILKQFMWLHDYVIKESNKEIRNEFQSEG